MPTEMHHFAMTVSDMDRSIAWYTTYFDLHQVLRTHLTGDGISSAMQVPGTKLEAVLLAGSNTLFELICFDTPKGRPYASSPADVGVAHPCFAVDDVVGLHARMVADGVHVNAPPQVLGWETKMFYCLDPDGLIVEVLQPGGPLQLDAFLAQATA